MHSINAEVPLDSVPCLGIQCAICFWFCGAALVQTQCDSEVVCALLQLWTLNREGLDGGAKQNENTGEDTTTKSWYVVF